MPPNCRVGEDAGPWLLLRLRTALAPLAAVLVLMACGGSSPDSSSTALPNATDGRRTMQAVSAAAAKPSCAAGARIDLDGNGTSDLIWRDVMSGLTTAWLMEGSAYRQAFVISADANLLLTATPDLDGDGRCDLLFHDASSGTTQARLMNGTQVRASAVLLIHPSFKVVATPDLNGDGKADLVWHDESTGQTTVWLMDGLQYISTASLLTDLDFKVVGIPDLDGDGKADLLWHNPITGQTSAWLMDGRSYKQAALLLAHPDLEVFATPDLDGDGKSDLLWYDPKTGRTVIWLMNGVNYKAATQLLEHPEFRVSATPDLNGDGKADLLWYDAASGETAAWLMDGSRYIGAASLLTHPGFRVIAAPDLDGDGRADLLWHDAKAGETSAWRMAGLSISASNMLFEHPDFRPHIASISGVRLESTVVMRVVGTGPAWGAEPIPGWPRAAPIKRHHGYRLFDAEIRRNAAGQPTGLNLFAFENSDIRTGMAPDRYPAIRAKRLLLARDLDGTSTSLLQALTEAVRQIVRQDPSTRFVIAYSGHGGPERFFEGTLALPDAERFVQTTREATRGSKLLLDFSTNCDVGYFDFAVRFHDQADYLFASDLPVGGFGIDNIEEWLKHQHDANLHRFLARDRSTVASLADMVTARQGVWASSAMSIAAVRQKQSVSAFDLRQLRPLMSTLKASGFTGPMVNANEWNIATYAYNTMDPVQVAALERFRIFYASNRNLFAWDANPRGFAVSNRLLVDTYLASLP